MLQCAWSHCMSYNSLLIIARRQLICMSGMLRMGWGLCGWLPCNHATVPSRMDALCTTTLKALLFGVVSVQSIAIALSNNVVHWIVLIAMMNANDMCTRIAHVVYMAYTTTMYTTAYYIRAHTMHTHTHTYHQSRECVCIVCAARLPLLLLHVRCASRWLLVSRPRHGYTASDFT